MAAFGNPDRVQAIRQVRALKPCIVYGGAADQERSNAQVLSWRSLDRLYQLSCSINPSARHLLRDER